MARPPQAQTLLHCVSVVNLFGAEAPDFESVLFTALGGGHSGKSLGREGGYMVVPTSLTFTSPLPNSFTPLSHV